MTDLTEADALMLRKDEFIQLWGNIAGDAWKEMRERLDARKHKP